MGKRRQSIWSHNKLHSKTGRSPKRCQLICELLELRQLLANNVLSSIAKDMCLAMDSVPSEPAAMIAKQSSRSNETTKKAFDGSVSVGPEIKEKPTHHYVADGRAVGMVISPTRVAVQFKSGAPDASTLRELGLTYLRPVGSDFAVYETRDAVGTDIKRAPLASSALVAKVAPVFVIQSSNSEAVLLDEIIVALQPGIAATEYFDGNANFSAHRPLPGTPDQFIATVANGTGEAALAVANEVISDERVAWVSPNFYQSWQKYFIPNDARFGNQWHNHNTGQGSGLIDADVDLPEAWDINQGGSASITIAVIDDGVSIDHPDIEAWTNPGEIAGDSIDNDGNGWVDDVNGWNFVANNNQSFHTNDSDMHGTSVSGVAAAKGNNGIGVAGASYKSKVLSAKMFEGAAVASDANIAAALYYTAGRNASGTGNWNAAAVVNNSWGGGGTSTVINAALTWGTTLGRQGAGATYFFATGNGFGAVSEPAVQSLNIPGVIAVGATNNLGTLSNYSNFGPAVDFAAPSDDSRAGYLTIDTTDRIGAAGYDPSDYTGIGANGFGGTSSATPLASGIGALLLAQASVQSIPFSPTQLRSYLRNNTDIAGNGMYEFSTTNGKNNGFGYGRLNAARALQGLGKAEISVTSITAELFDAASTLNLGSIIVGESQQIEYTIRVRNQGTSVLDLSSVTIASGPFSIARGFDDSSLAMGEATNFAIRYLPTGVGVDTRTITILSSDADEAEFTFDVTASAIAPSVGGQVFEDWDGDAIKDAADTIIASRTIYLDTIANGAFDTALGTNTFTNTTPLGIRDNVAVTSTIPVTGVTNFITDVNVMVNITHTWDSDLDVTLIAPNGTRILMIFAAGDDGDNFINTVLDDEAATSITVGVAPFTGSFRPFQPLSILDGLSSTDANGTWSLEVEDFSTGDEGTLNNWSITITTGEQSTQSKANGFYAFFALPNASYTARQVVPTGWTASGPAGGYAFTIATATDSFIGRDFGSGQNNKFYGQVFEDTNKDGVFDATEASLGGRTIFLDGNTNGILDAPAITTLSNATPLPIPDLASVTSTINSSVAGNIADLNVRISISHTFDSDLDVFLVHPDGTQVELFTDVGGTGANFVNTVLDQQAATGVIGSAGFNTAPFTGTFRPEGDLTVLNGKLASGIWTLRVIDDFSGDIGTLDSWDLIIGASPDISTTTAADGRANFSLAAGANQVRLAPIANFENTIPTDGQRTVNAIGTPLFDQRFGSTLAPSLQVTSVKVGSTSWVAAFNNAVDPTGVAGQHGFTVPAGPAILPWSNINTLFVKFTEDVNPTTLTNANVKLFGVLATSSISGAITFDNATNLAKITLSAPLTTNRLRLELSSSILSLGGSALDGDSNNVPGGTYNFLFNVLPGDANQGGNTDIVDVAAELSAFGAVAGGLGYNPMFDVNGSGNIDIVDVAVTLGNFGAILPVGSPGSAGSGSVGSGSAGGGSGNSTNNLMAQGLGTTDASSKSDESSKSSSRHPKGEANSCPSDIVDAPASVGSTSASFMAPLANDEDLGIDSFASDKEGSEGSVDSVFAGLSEDLLQKGLLE